MKSIFVFGLAFVFLQTASAATAAKVDLPLCPRTALGEGSPSDLLRSNPIFINSILEHKKIEKEINSDSEYAKAYKALRLNNQSFVISDANIKINNLLGSGYRGNAYLAEDNDVYKIPNSPRDMPTFEIELAIEAYLLENYARYGIKVLGSKASGPLGSYIKRTRIPAQQMVASILAAQNGALSEKQSRSLKTFWQRAKQFALDTGIGLDIKADNLFWDGQQWGIFDVGPRTSYLPYGFTVDAPDFESYLEIWQQSEPQGLQSYTSIKEMIQKIQKKSELRNQVMKEFNGNPSFNNPMTSIESMVEIRGLPSIGNSGLTHHLNFREIAENQGRISVDPDLSLLKDAVHVFVILDDGTFIFGEDDTGLEIGVKHFQLANGRSVIAAGEFDVDKFNVESGSYMKKLKLKGIPGYSEEKTKANLIKLFSQMRGRPVYYTPDLLVRKPKSIQGSDLQVYCWQNDFRRLHPSICKE